MIGDLVTFQLTILDQALDGSLLIVETVADLIEEDADPVIILCAGNVPKQRPFNHRYQFPLLKVGDVDSSNIDGRRAAKDDRDQQVIDRLAEAANLGSLGDAPVPDEETRRPLPVDPVRLGLPRGGEQFVKIE